MNRRDLFRSLPGAALALSTPLAIAEPKPDWDILNELPPGSLWTVYRSGEAIAKSVTVGALRSMRLEGEDVIEREFPQPPEPSPWVELTCTARFGPQENWEDRPLCETKFKTIRGTTAYCPKCGMATAYINPDSWRQFVGIEVK